jgi:hypothetical protein
MSKNIKVYWCPVSEKSDMDWNILFYDPELLMSNLNINKNKPTPASNFFKCPAFINEVKNTFVLKNPISSEYIKHDNTFIPISPAYVALNFPHDDTLKNNKLVSYKMSWIFFTEEDSLEMSLTSPYFSNSPHLQYGSIVPGRFDIGKWFRNINTEFNIWEDSDRLSIEDKEPIAYVKFHTNKNIDLVRFTMNDRLEGISNTTGRSSTWMPHQTLIERYKKFKETRTKDVVLREIKKNLL